MGTETDGRRLAPQKHGQILHAALQVFLEVGFERATTDAIAARAGVSKATLYNHFDDKGLLFAACVKAEADALAAGALAACVPATPSGGVENDLRILGVRLARHLLSRQVNTLHAVIVAEARRFPDLARALYESGFQRVRSIVASFLQNGIPDRALMLEDASVAAMHFVWLCIGDLKLRLELGLEQAAREDEIRRAVNQGVAAFMRAYGNRTSDPRNGG